MHLLQALLTTALLLATTASASYDSINTAMFQYDPAQAARQSAPIWLFGRSQNREPCYPTDAAPGGSPNPGSAVPAGPNPGNGCVSPGSYKGRNTHGNSFPTYYTVRKCGDDSWRIGYSVYFQHDGMSQLGHRHDWEWVAAVWKRCNGNGDFWCRDRLVRSFHKSNKSNNWDGIQNTVNEPSQVGDLGQKNKHHPLIFVGAFKHAMFDTRKTSMNVIGADELEFRSDDWYYFSQDNMVDGNTIQRGWDYGEAKSTPPAVGDMLCGM